MCGIFGLIGKGNRLGDLVEGLRKLEYRGYDSAGIAYISGNRVEVGKKSGRVSVLEEMYAQRLQTFVNAGIAHTRWATHGNPNDVNAHPHTDCSGKIAVVHNGIIENFSELKNELLSRGHRLHSDTDTELIAHLVEEYYGGDLLEAVLAASKRLRGAFAIGVLHADCPEQLVIAREGSPLVVGKTPAGAVMGSDVTPLLKYTRDVFFVEDGEFVLLSPQGIQFFTSDGRWKKHDPVRVDWEEEAAEKGGFKFFMEKEISEEPRVIQQALSGRLVGEKVHFPELQEWESFLQGLEGITLVAAGTSWHASLVFQALVREALQLRCDVEIASEFRFRKIFGNPQKELFLFISQSGETTDTLESLRLAKKEGFRTLAITNVIGSTITREAEKTLFLHAGPEIGVASTKAYVGQLVVLYLLLAFLIQNRGLALEEGFLEDLSIMPSLFQNQLSQKQKLAELARRYAFFHHFMYIGRGLHYPTALEGALKIKEISYIHATAYPGGELKHGPIALLDEGFPVFAIAPHDRYFAKMKSNILETQARNARVICLVSEDLPQESRVQADTIEMPRVHPWLFPLVSAPVIQLFSYFVADLRGLDVDKPRNLAKSVTVE
ncbi:MAG TPA: glutamine--fructose-6-phosphate transaminase (isomerizing) [Thermotogota bacterium]|nr:glutamine--fructose-6-phosphate transaminase (isomerizing) [Thermotogota bacterium]HRW91818.1 glutamine--fructose-6-phosphate transaminase (isomerizing) [Thermotogota bacterium]